MKVCSLFAGIGGIDKGCELAGHTIVYANEFDKQACKAYRANNNPDVLDECDITKKDITQIPKFDILVGGFPCQPFSQSGKQQSLNDKRGLLFKEIVKILKYHQPLSFMLENVPRLVTIDEGKTFKLILDELCGAGYNCHYEILGSHTHANIPQGRKRVFIIGFKDKVNYTFPTVIPLTTTVDDIIFRNIKVADKYYYTNDSQYHQLLIKNIIDNAIYQLRRIYVRRNQNNLCPTLTANMGTGGYNVPLIKDNFGIRKLTPMECAKFQGFDNFIQVCSDSQTYKQIGNSVCVPLIKRLLDF